jgi:hypothetical protein
VCCDGLKHGMKFKRCRNGTQKLPSKVLFKSATHVLAEKDFNNHALTVHFEKIVGPSQHLSKALTQHIGGLTCCFGARGSCIFLFTLATSPSIAATEVCSFSVNWLSPLEDLVSCFLSHLVPSNAKKSGSRLRSRPNSCKHPQHDGIQRRKFSSC